MTKLLERRPDLDAVFVASDVMALGALSALRRAGRRVPEDVAIGGFDDSSAAVAARPALTTIRQPYHADQQRDGPAAARRDRRRIATLTARTSPTSTPSPQWCWWAARR